MSSQPSYYNIKHNCAILEKQHTKDLISIKEFYQYFQTHINAISKEIELLRTSLAIRGERRLQSHITRNSVVNNNTVLHRPSSPPPLVNKQYHNINQQINQHNINQDNINQHNINQAVSSTSHQINTINKQCINKDLYVWPSESVPFLPVTNSTDDLYDYIQSSQYSTDLNKIKRELEFLSKSYESKFPQSEIETLSVSKNREVEPKITINSTNCPVRDLLPSELIESARKEMLDYSSREMNITPGVKLINSSENLIREDVISAPRQRLSTNRGVIEGNNVSPNQGNNVSPNQAALDAIKKMQNRVNEIIERVM